MEILNGEKNRRGGVYLAAAGAALAAALVFLACRQTGLERYMKAPAARAREATVATLEKAAGGVLVRRENALDYSKAAEGTDFHGGDLVQTTGGAKAILLFPDGTRVNLGGDSLLAISGQPGGGPETKTGSVLRMEKGEISISSEEPGDSVSELRTPGAVIRLRARRPGIFRPAEYRDLLPPGGGASDAAARHGYLYLAYLKDIYLPESMPDTADPRIPEILKLLDAMEKTCSAAFDARCLAAQDAAWFKFSAAAGVLSGAGKVAFTASVGEDGKEEITVTKGVVEIETKTRTLAVAGGESLRLEPGKTITRPDVSIQARREVYAGAAEREEDFVEVEAFYWQ